MGLGFWRQRLHAQFDLFLAAIGIEDPHLNFLSDTDHVLGFAHIIMRHLTHVEQAGAFGADIHKSAKLFQLSHFTANHHVFL